MVLRGPSKLRIAALTTLTVLGSMAAGSAGAGSAGASSRPSPGVWPPLGTHQSRIIDGTVATINPGAVSLSTRAGVHNCTGSLISPRWVLTARHCIPDNVIPEVRVGHIAWAKGELVSVSETILATGFDLALLKLSRDVTNVPPVKLAETDTAVKSELTMWGWGMTAMNATNTNPDLKFAKGKLDTFNDRDAHGGKAMSVTGLDGTVWQGDSGGPAFTSDFVQVGVASTAQPWNKQNTYTRVSQYRTWIREKTGV